MRSLDPRVVLRVGCYCLLGVLLALGVRALAAGDPAENPAYSALSKAHTRRMVADSVALVQAHEALAAAQSRTARTITQYRSHRDTLRITDTIAVKEFVARADSVVRSCSELSNACERFRVRAESSLASLRLDRDRWRQMAEDSRPNAISRFVRRTLPVVTFGLGLYVGARAVR